MRSHYCIEVTAHCTVIDYCSWRMSVPLNHHFTPRTERFIPAEGEILENWLHHWFQRNLDQLTIWLSIWSKLSTLSTSMTSLTTRISALLSPRSKPDDDGNLFFPSIESRSATSGSYVLGLKVAVEDVDSLEDQHSHTNLDSDDGEVLHDQEFSDTRWFRTRIGSWYPDWSIDPPWRESSPSNLQSYPETRDERQSHLWQTYYHLQLTSTKAYHWPLPTRTGRTLQKGARA